MDNQNQVLPAIISLLIPGLGQLLQGRNKKGVTFLVLWFLALFTVVLLVGVILVPIVHIWACINAAGWRPADGPNV